MFLGMVIFFSLTVNACHQSQKKSDNSETSADTLVKNPDSIDSMPPPPKPGLSPGFAKIEGDVLGIAVSEKSRKSIIRFKIKKIVGYGASTPPLAVNDTLEIYIEEKELASHKHLIGPEKIFLVQNIQVPSLEGESSSEWSFRKIIID